ISRLGYRKRADEPEDWKFDQPMVLLQSGDRMNIELPDRGIEVMTRYGRLLPTPTSIVSIALQTDEHGVHQITLNDGSKFAGLLTADAITLKLKLADAPV